MTKSQAEQAIEDIINQYAKKAGKMIRSIQVEVGSVGVSRITDPIGSHLTYTVELEVWP